MATPPIFPAETICRILRYSNPRDIVQWRTVSKWFCDITYDASIWGYLYANSSLPRPSGPFPFQSAAYLERTLLRSEKLAQSWVTRPIRDLSHVELRVGKQPEGRVKLLGRRFLVGCESASRFVLHDVDAYHDTQSHASQKQVIWEQAEPVLAWAASSITTEDGRFIIYVLLNEGKDIPQCRLLEFCFNGESVEPCAVDAFDVPISNFEPYSIGLHIVGKAPFLHLPECGLVFDTRTRTFYEFPEFPVALDNTWYQTDEISCAPDCVELTSTHVIALYSFLPYPITSVTLLQAFIVDESSVRNGKGVLRRSHEGVSDRLFGHFTLLRNSIVDPITGSTNVRLLGSVGPIHGFLALWVDLTLPKSSGNEVLPITIDMHVELEYSKTEKLYGWGSAWGFGCTDAGPLRGFMFYGAKHPRHPGGLVKFTLDVTQDESTFAVGDVLRPEWNHVNDPTDSRYGKYITSFDASGRFCLVKHANLDDPELVVVVDVE